MGRKSPITVSISGLSLLPRSARTPHLYAAVARRAFALARHAHRGELSIVFTPRKKMEDLNRQYLNHTGDTDVITFSYEPDPLSAEAPLGDIFISSWLIPRQAREQGHSARREAATLVAHGALHLLGYDDVEPQAKKKMFRLQDRIVKDSRA